MSVVILQGGNEFSAGARDMDTGLLSVAIDGPVVVVALAARPGADYAGAGRRATTHFASLGADVVVAPDARDDMDAAVADVRRAGAVVVPGGSPRSLRDAVVGTAIGAAIVDRHRAGAPVMGSSAGAMVACATTLLPGGQGGPPTAPGLGLVADLVVVPHYDGGRLDWVEAGLAVADVVLGIPECSGIVVAEDGSLVAIGTSPTTRLTAQDESTLPVTAWP